MLDHHIQRNIVNSLKSSQNLSFTDLRPKELDNKLFTYHLKIVIREGFVNKTKEGRYKLTPSGEKLWKRMSETPQAIALRPMSLIFIVIRQSEKGWLLYKRKTHPALDRIAFMHTNPRGELPISESAKLDVLEKTGLECDFIVAGSGFFHTYSEQRLDGFINFTLLACESPRGSLTPNDENAEYFWDQDPDFKSPQMLPNMQPLSENYLAKQFPFFLDKSVSLAS